MASRLLATARICIQASITAPSNWFRDRNSAMFLAQRVVHDSSCKMQPRFTRIWRRGIRNSPLPPNLEEFLHNVERPSFEQNSGHDFDVWVVASELLHPASVDVMRARDRTGHISPAVLRGLCLQPYRRNVRQLLGRPLGHVIAVSIPLQNHLFHTHTNSRKIHEPEWCRPKVGLWIASRLDPTPRAPWECSPSSLSSEDVSTTSGLRDSTVKYIIISANSAIQINPHRSRQQPQAASALVLPPRQPSSFCPISRVPARGQLTHK